MKIIEKTFDASTQQENITEREETADERTMRLAFLEKASEMEAEAQKQAIAKQAAEAKLFALGLDLDDLRALGL